MAAMTADMSPMLILADIGDWFKLIVPAIFVIFWVISQLSGGDAAKARKPQRQGAPPRDPNDGNVRNEIEDFLRRVKQQAGIPDEDDDDVDWDEEPEFAQARPASVQEARVLEAEVIEPGMSAGLPSGVGSSDVAHAGDSFVQHAETLGADVGHADENMAMHTHEVFDHAVGELDKAAGGQPSSDAPGRRPAVPAAAGEIRRMLSGADGVRKAIVMSEILNRPTDRW